ncbi:MAG: WD40 repeat domain-containing protein [Campylobacterota bacterium]|nr:WD40 repeat domain-containing protein [Campylobacterota bacterium]
MIKPYRIVKLNSKIVSMACFSDNRLGVITDDHYVHFLNTPKGSIDKTFMLASMGNQPKKLAFSSDAHYLAYATQHYIYLIDLEIQKAITRIEIDAAQAEILCFDSDNKHLIAGTNTGRVLLWQCEHQEMLSRLTSFPEHTHHMIPPLNNYVSALAHYRHLVASSGYGDSVVISDYLSGAHPIRIYSERSRINTIVFLDENCLLVGNEEGKVGKLYIHENRPHRQLSASIGAIKHMVILSDKTFALVASTHKDIALINIDTMEVIESHYISVTDNITAMVLGRDMLLYIAQESGLISCAKLMPVETLQMRIENRQFELAYELVQEFPILKESSWFHDLEKIFAQHYAMAIQALLLGDDNRAHHHLKAFIHTPIKKKNVQDLFYAFHHYKRLQYLLEKSLLNAAYGLVEAYPPLKMTPEFRAIEKEWEDLFSKAQKLIIKDKEIEAKKILQAFNRVSSKAPLIRLLLEVSTDIIHFSKAIASRDYTRLHKMTKRYPALKMMPSHQSVIEESDLLIEEIMNALKEDRFKDAHARCELLLDMPHLQKHYEHISHFIQKAEHLFRVEADNELRQCYETLDSAAQLAILPRSKMLESRWQDMMNVCENAALKGDVADILKCIKPVMPLPSRQEKLGSLLRLAYLIQIRTLDKDDQGFQIGVTNYARFFGSDSELQQLLKQRDIDIPWISLPRDHWLTFYSTMPAFIYEAI